MATFTKISSIFAIAQSRHSIICLVGFAALENEMITLPNVLTLSRILVILPIIGMFWLEGDWPRWVTLGLYAAACITDFFDGYLARTRGEISRFGRFLDPVADKLLIASVILCFAPSVGLKASRSCRRRHSMPRNFGVRAAGVSGWPPQRFTRQQAREMENNNTNVRSGLSHCRHLGAGLDTPPC